VNKKIFRKAAQLVCTNPPSKDWGVSHTRLFLRGQSLEGSSGAASEEFVCNEKMTSQPHQTNHWSSFLEA
jgi:hypothetical protein